MQECYRTGLSSHGRELKTMVRPTRLGRRTLDSPSYLGRYQVGTWPKRYILVYIRPMSRQMQTSDLDSTYALCLLRTTVKMRERVWDM